MLPLDKSGFQSKMDRMKILIRYIIGGALLLSAETAVGQHPAHVISMMDRIIRSAEAEAAR
jgi:hypothetical protein